MIRVIIIFICVVASFLGIIFQNSTNELQKAFKVNSLEKVLLNFKAKTFHTSYNTIVNKK
jgi:hypothetical protein